MRVALTVLVALVSFAATAAVAPADPPEAELARSNSGLGGFPEALLVLLEQSYEIAGYFLNTENTSGGPFAITGARIRVDLTSNTDGGSVRFGRASAGGVEGSVTCPRGAGGDSECFAIIELGNVAAGAELPVTLTIEGRQAGTATIEMVATQNEFDPDPSNNTVSIGLEVTDPPTIWGQKWYDDDGDGQRGDDEGPVDGWPIDLLASDGSIVASTVTGPLDLDGDEAIDPITERGIYAFDLPPDGAYTVVELVPEGWSAIPAGGVHEIQVNGNTVSSLDYYNDPPPNYPTDWGDAPISYGTIRPGGASHLLVGIFPPILGVDVDAEPDGQPTPDASGDDLFLPPTQGDDEDGLVALTFGDGTAGELTVRSLLGGILDAWLDHDDDGTFAQADNHIVAAAALAVGETTLPFTIPTGAARGGFLRLRIHSVPGGVGPTGFVFDGEVEDHLAFGLDLGDANQDPLEIIPGMPWGYPVRISVDGARHLTNDLVRLGDRVDAETDLNVALASEVGLASNTATGDDNDPDDNQNDGPRDDEDGIAFGDGFIPFTIQLPVGTAEPSAPNPLTRYGIVVGSTATLTFFPNVDGGLDAWVDWNRDGDWLDDGEQIFANERIGPGTPPPMRDITAPAGASIGYTHARFRFSRNGALNPTGYANDGEVEDYLMAIYPPVDFGDAPAPYPTAGGEGPRHAVGSVRLGAEVDGETEASADDADDGVALPPGEILRGVDAALAVTVAGDAPASLYGWVDWNGDGDWDDADEQVLDGSVVAAGDHAFSVPVPAGAVPGATWARFRVSRVALPFTPGADLDPLVVAFITEGEVEDYPLTISANAVAAEDAPAETAIEAVGPNPARGAVTVRLALAAPGEVSVRVVDTLGREVLALPASARSMGRHDVRLDVSALPSGTYLVLVETDGAFFVRPVTVVR